MFVLRGFPEHSLSLWAPFPLKVYYLAVLRIFKTVDVNTRRKNVGGVKGELLPRESKDLGSNLSSAVSQLQGLRLTIQSF